METRFLFFSESIIHLFLVRFLIAVPSILFPLWTVAQSTDYLGRDFWFTSIDNNFAFGQDSAVLYLVGDTACTGYVENPNSSYYKTFNISPGAVTIVMIPSSEIQSSQIEPTASPIVENTGIHLSVTHYIYAFLQTHNLDSSFYSNLNYVYVHTKKCPLIPVHHLSDHIYCNTYNTNWNYLIKLYVVALENNVLLDFRGYLGNQSLSLNKGQVAVFPNANFQSFFRVQSNCKKIACYYGGHNASVFYPAVNVHLILGKDFILKKSCNDHFSKFLYPNNAQFYASDWEFCTCNHLGLSHYTAQHTSEIQAYVYKHVRCNWVTTPYLTDVPFLFYRFYDSPSQYYRRPLWGRVFFNPIYQGTGNEQTISFASLGVLNNTSPNHLPNDIMVKKWVIPTTRRNVQVVNCSIDTVLADLQIYVHENGLHSTYLNGQLLPASVFDSVPFTNRDYWVAQFGYYNDSIPEIIRVENPNGFSAYLDEFGYSPDSEHPGNIVLGYYHDNNSGVNFNTAPVEHSNLSPYMVDTVYRCLGDTLHLDVEYNPDSLEFDWIVDGITHYNTRTLDIPITDLHTITAQLVIHYPCPDTTTTFVRVLLPPVIPFSSDTTLCAGATLSAETPDALLYTWSTGETTPAITIDSAGIYSVTVANRGCTASLDSFRVELYEPSHVDFGQDTTLCDLASLLLDATQTHPATYEWQDHSTNTTYTVLFDGEYWVVVTDHCLGASDTIAVDYLHDFEVNLGTDTTLCEGDELVLSANLPFCTYRWQDGSTDPRYVVRQSGSYSVTATNLCYSHNDDIDIDYESCAQELWMPNAFTPNGDGLNDRFLPVFSHPDEIEDFEMMVYDRWGSMVFLTKDIHAGWDGGNLPRGMYVWVVRYKSAREEERTVKGSVMLGR